MRKPTIAELRAQSHNRLVRFKNKMKNLFNSVKDKIWDYFFLDFYLDKGWTWRFKLMNFISGGVLREYYTEAKYHINLASNDYKSEYEKCLHIRRAQYWMDAAWNLWRN